jgi:CRP-like cAMP-binding protein
MSNQLIDVFNSISSISKEEEASLLNIIKEKHLPKGDFWSREGVLVNEIAFVRQGYLRKFYLNNDNEVTDSFYFDNEFCADLPSIIGKQKANSFFVAMQPSNLIIIPYGQFQALCQKYHAFEHIYRILLEQVFLKFYNRTQSFINQTPKERYDQLVKHRPKILSEATQYHIASYIGISYQHLSRLRAEK